VVNYRPGNSFDSNAWTQSIGWLGLDVKQSLPNPTDVSEKEERRRTFWMAFCMDRYAGVGTGWPLIVDERDVRTPYSPDRSRDHADMT
jgi:hypothetical protein